jgi:hypothetical protein
MFQTKVVEKIETHILYSITFFFENRAVCDNVGQATVDNMAHCMLDTSGYKHTLIIRNSYYFSTTTMAARTRLNVTLYVHCVSCSALNDPITSYETTFVADGG